MSDYETRKSPRRETWLPAFTVAELGEMLPDGNHLGVDTTHGIGGWITELKTYDEMPYRRLHMITGERSEADARAKMLVYLLENKLITN